MAKRCGLTHRLMGELHAAGEGGALKRPGVWPSRLPLLGDGPAVVVLVDLAQLCPIRVAP